MGLSMVFMGYCPACEQDMHLVRLKRTAFEKRFFRRQEIKCQCESCKTVFFINLVD